VLPFYSPWLSDRRVLNLFTMVSCQANSLIAERDLGGARLRPTGERNRDADNMTRRENFRRGKIPYLSIFVNAGKESDSA
jgi:hypothetical protein